MKNKSFDRHRLQWLKERDEALATLDLEKFKAFYIRYKEKGLYKMNLPNDDVAEIAMYKCAYKCTGIPFEKRVIAAQWLISHGYGLGF